MTTHGLTNADWKAWLEGLTKANDEQVEMMASIVLDDLERRKTRPTLGVMRLG